MFKRVVFLVVLSFALVGCFANQDFVRQCTQLSSGLVGCDTVDNDTTIATNKPKPPKAPKIEPLVYEELVEEMDPIAESLKKWCPIEADPRAYTDSNPMLFPVVHRHAEIRFAEAILERYPYGVPDHKIDELKRQVKYTCNFLFVYYEKVYEYEQAKLDRL